MALNGHRLRVAQLIGSMSVGGAENLAVRVAGALAARGHHSHLVVARGPGPLSERISPEVHTHYLHFERESIKRPVAFAASVARGLAQVRRIVRGHDIQVIQTHLPGANFLGLPLELTRICPVVATVHNNQEFNYGDSDRIRAALRKQAYRWLLRVDHGVVAVSSKVKHSLVAELGVPAHFGERISVVDNGVEIPPAIDPEERQRLRAAEGADDRQLLVAVGRLTAQKNFADLLRAVARARELGVHARLVIAVEGEERPALEALRAELDLGDEVAMPGIRDDIDQLMQAADLLVMSSLWEGLPLVALEAQAAALPVVAYAIPGTAELVTDGRTGFTAPVGDPLALGERIVDALSDPQRLLSVGEAGRQQVIQRYSFDRTVDDLVAVYRRASR
jgi:glycosyltransferase involved in cell wall biosynthesis